ncbi:unnamed protein product [Urochloa decumbens]|uniref:Uncharacterized protein n=1 Tax=Urochloa decumbens TaxID=240449 RepID=A0ABC9CPE0_9POAL
MARKVTAFVASALLLALVSLSYDAGVEAWCLEYPAPDINACRGSRGVKTCGDECRDVGHGFVGGQCLDNNDCVCLKCADEPPHANTQ